MPNELLIKIDDARVFGDYDQGVPLALDALKEKAFAASDIAFINLRLADMLNEMSHETALKFGYEDRRKSAVQYANKAIKLFPNTEEYADRIGDAYVAWGVALWFQESEGPNTAKKKFLKASEFFSPETEVGARKYINTHHCMGLCEHSLGNLSVAATHYERVLPITLDKGFDDALLNTRRCLANVYGDECRLEAAAKLLDLIEEDTGSDFASQIQWLNARVLVAVENGEFQYAHKLYDKIHDLFSTEKTASPELGAALTNAATFKLQNGYPSQANAILNLANSMDKKNAPVAFRIGLAKTNAAFAFVEGYLEETKEFLQAAKDIAKNDLNNNEEKFFELLILDVETRTSVTERKQWASSVIQEVDLETAYKEKDLLKGQRLLALALAGEIMIEQGNYNEAELKQLLIIGFRACCARTSNDNIWQFYSLLSNVFSTQGKRFASAFFGKLAIEAIHKLAKPVPLRSLQRDAILKRRRRPFDRTQKLLSQLGRFNEAQNIRDLFRKDLALNTGPIRRHLQSSEAELKYSSLETELKFKLDQIRDNLAIQFNDIDMRTGLPVTDEFNGLLTECDEFFSQLWNFKEPKRITLKYNKTKNALLKQKEGQLSFLEDGQKVYCQLATKNGVQSEIMHSDFGQISSLISSLNYALINEKPSWRKTAEKLSDILLKPIADKLRILSSLKIYVSGAFSQIPFCALPLDGKLLVETHEITYQLALEDSQNKNRLIDSNVYILGAGLTEKVKDIPFLSSVETELQDIANKFANCTCLKGSDFTIEKFKDVLENDPTIVHLSTHFQLHPGSLEESYLVFSSGERLHFSRLSGDDFNWQDVDLLFLSACETATGDWSEHGLDTVPTLFRRLGVRQVIGTLWPVFDTSTCHFVREFYEYISKGRSSSQALQETQYASMSGPLFNHPVHWAAFKSFE